jgi:hypothetical protein
MADLEDHCWVGRHLQYAVGLGMPMLFIYVLGLPLAAYYLARRTHLMAYKVQELVEELGVDGAVEAEGGAKKKEERKSLKRMLTDTRRFRRESEGGGGGGHIHLNVQPHESSSSVTTPSSQRPVKGPSKHRRWISRGINGTNRTNSQIKKIQEIEQLLEQVEESHKTYGLFYSMYNEGRSL